MKQSLKSLSAQMKDIEIDGFVLDTLKKGDYGYNMAYGCVDGQIQVGIKIPYQDDKDEDAAEYIKTFLQYSVDTFRLISKKLSPKHSKLVKLIDGEKLFTYDIGYEVDGKRIDFTSPQCYWIKNHPSYKPPIMYSAPETINIMKKTIHSYIKNFKTLLNTRGFELIKYEMSNDGENIFVLGKQKFVNYAVITGKAFGNENTFVIKNFESENIKKRMKTELENFKSGEKSGNEKVSNKQRTIDLRSYPEVVEVYTKADRLENSFMNAHNKYRNEVRKCKCEECKNYNSNKDIRAWRFEGGVDVDGRFSTCIKPCENFENIKLAMESMAKKKNKLDEYNKTVFVPTLLKFFEKTNPTFIHWLTGEKMSWKEVFPNADTVVKNRDVILLQILLSSGFSGEYIWENDVITLRGELTTNDRKELIVLGKDTNHNIGNAYMPIRDDELTIDKDGKIVYNYSKDGEIEEYNKNLLSSTKRLVQMYGTNRLTKNYEIFKTPQDRYKVNAMLSIYFNFLGDFEKSKHYKQIVKSLPETKIEKDEKIEKLLNGMK